MRSVKAFRSQLARKNDFFSEQPPVETDAEKAARLKGHWQEDCSVLRDGKGGLLIASRFMERSADRKLCCMGFRSQFSLVCSLRHSGHKGLWPVPNHTLL